MYYNIFYQIGAVPGIIADLKKELIKMQHHYAIEKSNINRDFALHGIGTRGTEAQYKEISEKLYSNIDNIHNILTKEEIHLLGPDSYIENNYADWYTDTSIELCK